MSFNYDCFHCGSNGGGCLECGKKFSYDELRKYKEEVREHTIREILKILESQETANCPRGCALCGYAKNRTIEEIRRRFLNEN